MTQTTAASLLLAPTLEPSTAAPASDDDVLFDPADDLLPKLPGEDAEPEPSPWEQQPNAGPWSEGQGEPDTDEAHEACIDLADCFAGCILAASDEVLCDGWWYDEECFDSCSAEHRVPEDHESQAAQLAFACDACPDNSECFELSMECGR